jgi:hypothetical protein
MILFSERTISIQMDASSLMPTVTQLMGLLSGLYQQQKTSHTGSKPVSVAVRQYESAVYAFRDQRLSAVAKGISQLLVDSVDAFEAGRVLDAGRLVMLALEQVESAAKESEVTMTAEQAATLGQFRSGLFKMVVPAPELKQKRVDL